MRRIRNQRIRESENVCLFWNVLKIKKIHKSQIASLLLLHGPTILFQEPHSHNTMESSSSSDDDFGIAIAIILACEKDLRTARTPRPTTKKRGRIKNPQPPSESVFHSLLYNEHNADATYRYLFRMDKKYFERLLLNYNGYWWNCHLRPNSRGVFRERDKKKHRKITARMSLGMVLRYLYTTTEATDCAMQYCLDRSEYSKFLRHGLFCLKETLVDNEPLSTFCIPSIDDRLLYAEVISLASGGVLKKI